MSEWECLRWTEDDRKAILKAFDRTPETLRDDVAAIRAWLAKQPHLVDYEFSDHQIATLLILNKFRVEAVKTKLDLNVSTRRFFPEFFRNMQNKHLEKSFLSTYVVTLPHLTGDNARVYVSRLNEPHRDLFDANDYVIRILKLADLRLRYDCCLYDYYVIDCKWITMLQLTQFSPMVCKKLVTIVEKLYSLRCRGIYVVNAPKAVEKVVLIFKQFLKRKLADRIQVSDGHDILKELIDANDLPSEYGGNGTSVAELSEMWKKKFEEIDDWLEYVWENPPNDAIRPGKPLDCEYFGIEGNFRRLEVD